MGGKRSEFCTERSSTLHYLNVFLTLSEIKMETLVTLWLHQKLTEQTQHAA